MSRRAEVLLTQILPRFYNSIEYESYKKYPTSSLYMFLSTELFGMLENCKQRDILALICLCINHIKYIILNMMSTILIYKKKKYMTISYLTILLHLPSPSEISISGDRYSASIINLFCRIITIRINTTYKNFIIAKYRKIYF